MMTQANDNKPIVKPIKYENLPTRERMAKGDFEIYDSGRGRNIPVARDKDVLRIDKLRTKGVLDEWQHSYGVQIITMHTIAHRELLGIRNVDYIQEKDDGDLNTRRNYSEERANSATDCKWRYNEIIRLMCQYQSAYWQLVTDLCFKELPMRIACQMAGYLHPRHHAKHVGDAFDLLGDCIQEMRGRKTAIEKILEGGTEKC